MSQYPAFMGPYVSPINNQLPPNAQSFIGYIQDGKIFRSDVQGPQAIGVSTKVHEDLQADYDNLYSTCKEYYDALVKAGVIVPEPTQEDLIRQQAEQLNHAAQVIAEGVKNQERLSSMIASLTEKLDAMSKVKETTHEHHTSNPVQNTRPVATDERICQPSVASDTRLPELPPRADAGDSGEESEVKRPAKRTRVSAKRAGR